MVDELELLTATPVHTVQLDGLVRPSPSSVEAHGCTPRPY